jgi:hypothetical protein
MLNWFAVVYPEARPGFAESKITIPDETEGICLLGQARLYASRLADRAWDGITKGILSHVCAVIAIPDAVTGPEGWIIEGSLTGHNAGNPRAKIINFEVIPPT